MDLRAIGARCDRAVRLVHSIVIEGGNRETGPAETRVSARHAAESTNTTQHHESFDPAHCIASPGCAGRQLRLLLGLRDAWHRAAFVARIAVRRSADRALPSRISGFFDRVPLVFLCGQLGSHLGCPRGWWHRDDDGGLVCIPCLALSQRQLISYPKG